MTSICNSQKFLCAPTNLMKGFSQDNCSLLQRVWASVKYLFHSIAQYLYKIPHFFFKNSLNPCSHNTSPSLIFTKEGPDPSQVLIHDFPAEVVTQAQENPLEKAKTAIPHSPSFLATPLSNPPIARFLPHSPSLLAGHVFTSRGSHFLAHSPSFLAAPLLNAPIAHLLPRSPSFPARHVFDPRGIVFFPGLQPSTRVVSKSTHC